MDRLGLIGKPSDWLIASTYDVEAIRTRLNCELVEINICEVTSLGEVESGEAGALKIYNRLREIVDTYQLTGLTLRCFDLLTTVKNTGCLALAKLNAEGIPAACEGDVPALLTMVLAHRLTGCSGFQCNPARVNTTTLVKCCGRIVPFRSIWWNVMNTRRISSRVSASPCTPTCRWATIH